MQEDRFTTYAADYTKHIAAAANGDPDAQAVIWRDIRRYGLSIAHRYADLLRRCAYDDDDDAQLAAIVYYDLLADWDPQKPANDFMKYYSNRLRWSIIKVLSNNIETKVGTTSMDAPIDADNDDLTLADTLADDGPAPDEVTEYGTDMAYLLEQLPANEREIIDRECIKGQSAAAVARELGRSRQYVIDNRTKALRRLRRYAADIFDSVPDAGAHKGVSAFYRTGTSIVEDVAVSRQNAMKRADSNRQTLIDDISGK